MNPKAVTKFLDAVKANPAILQLATSVELNQETIEQDTLNLDDPKSFHDSHLLSNDEE